MLERSFEIVVRHAYPSPCWWEVPWTDPAAIEAGFGRARAVVDRVFRIDSKDPFDARVTI